jgi:F-type H+-transporting ATPase subunit epsilon
MADEKKHTTSEPFLLDVVTPEGKVFSGNVVSVTCEGTEGRFQILHLHAPFLSSLATGITVLILDSGLKERYAMSGGFAQVYHDHVLLLVDSAEREDLVDAERAERAKARAEKRLKEKAAGLDQDRARAALLRAINRLKVANRL